MSLFNLEQALIGASVTTKDGRKVSNARVVNNSCPKSSREAADLDYKVGGNAYQQGIVVTIENDEGGSDFPYYHSGEAHLYGLAVDADLRMG
jgi:hypothetical protein